jgi:hypothetical protein
MRPTVIDGLPAHILLIHFVVVAVPLTALAVVFGAFSARGARRMGLLLPVLGLLTLASVPVTTSAGEWLERHVDSTALVRRHTELGDGLLPWAVGLFAMTCAVWWLSRRPVAERTGQAEPVAATGPQADGTPATAAPAAWRTATVTRAAVAVLACVIAVGAVVDVYRIGESGAKAAWSDSVHA